MRIGITKCPCFKELPRKHPGDATTTKVQSKIKCIGQVNQFVRVFYGKVPNHGFGIKKNVYDKYYLNRDLKVLN